MSLHSDRVGGYNGAKHGGLETKKKQGRATPARMRAVVCPGPASNARNAGAATRPRGQQQRGRAALHEQYQRLRWRWYVSDQWGHVPMSVRCDREGKPACGMPRAARNERMAARITLSLCVPAGRLWRLSASQLGDNVLWNDQSVGCCHILCQVGAATVYSPSSLRVRMMSSALSSAAELLQ